MTDISVAFWNLQNLFDITASEIAADFEFTPAQGWDQATLDKKIENLAEVLTLMHGGAGADLLGICEVENKKITTTLMNALGRPDYRLAHVESLDIRGIDTSLIYSKDVFDLVGMEAHLVHKRYPTRDIFEVNLRVLENDADLTVFVNHWPSRSAGKEKTEPYRLSVADHAGLLVDRQLKMGRQDFLALPDSVQSLKKLNGRWDMNVLLMGDFNDEPFNRSVLDYLKSSNSVDHLEEPVKKDSPRKIPTAKKYLGLQAHLFNCMWGLGGETDRGTYYFGKAAKSMNVLDQFVISRGLFYGLQKLQLDLDTVDIFRPSIMATSRKQRPKRFDKKTKKGYSDHFPIQAVIKTVP